MQTTKCWIYPKGHFARLRGNDGSLMIGKLNMLQYPYQQDIEIANRVSA
jgi:hypothetical protein